MFLIGLLLFNYVTAYNPLEPVDHFSFSKGGGHATIDRLRAKRKYQEINPEWVYGAVNIIKCCGAKLDGVTDNSKILQDALNYYEAVYIPNTYETQDKDNLGLLSFNTTITMTGKKLIVSGSLVWNAPKDANVPAIWLKQSSILEGASSLNKPTGIKWDVVRHFYDNVGGRHGDRDCAVLVNDGPAYHMGSIDNRIRNFVIQGYGVELDGSYSDEAREEIINKPEVECQYAAGKGIWLLAGGPYGIMSWPVADKSWWQEFVYGNSFENIRIDGYADSVMLEAGWLFTVDDPPLNPLPAGDERSPAGIVSGNKFDGLWIRNSRRYIHIRSPLTDYYPVKGGYSEQFAFCGSVEGNIFNNVHIKLEMATRDAATNAPEVDTISPGLDTISPGLDTISPEVDTQWSQTALVIKGGNFNQFQMVIDTQQTSKDFPLVYMGRGVPNVSAAKPNIARCSSTSNYVKVTGVDLSESNGGFFDEYSGNNRIDGSTSDITRNFFPIGSGDYWYSKTYPSFIGAVTNFWGNGTNLVGGRVTIYNLDDSGDRSGVNTDETPVQVSGKLFTPDVGDTWSYTLEAPIYGVEIEMTHKHEYDLRNTGVSFYGNYGAHKTVKIFYYGVYREYGEYLMGTAVLNCLHSAACVDTEWRFNVKRVVIQLFDKERYDSGHRNISLNGIFTESVSDYSTNNNYNLQPNQDTRMYGKSITFDYRLDQQVDPATGKLIDGCLFQGTTFYPGYPTSQMLRFMFYTMKINRPVEIGADMEFIMTDRTTKDKYNVYIDNGQVLAELI